MRTKGSTKNKNDDLDVRKRRTAEYNLGEGLTTGVQALNDEPSTTTFEARPVSLSSEEMLSTGRELNQSPSPLSTILERYANFEKVVFNEAGQFWKRNIILKIVFGLKVFIFQTIGIMIADTDVKIIEFLNSDTPVSKLLNDEIPAVTQAKKDLEQLVKRRQHTVSALERENKKLERMQNSINSKDPDREDVLDQQLLDQQIEKRDKLSYDVDMLAKDESQDQDKITSTLLTLVRKSHLYRNIVSQSNIF